MGDLPTVWETSQPISTFQGILSGSPYSNSYLGDSSLPPWLDRATVPLSLRHDMMIFKYVLALSLLSSSFSTDVDPETCEEADCALSLRQLRGQQYEARVWEHQGSLIDFEETPEVAPAAKATDTEGEGTEDPYSKAPDAPAAAPTATEGEGTEDPYSKAPDAPAEAPATEATATEAPAEAPTKKATATEAPAVETATEAPAEAPAAETTATEAPAAETATEAPAEAPAAETTATEAPAAETATEAPAEAPAAETPAEAPAAEAPAAETTATEAPAAAPATEGEGTEDPDSKPPDATESTPASSDEETEAHNMTQEEWEEKQGGLCCFTGSDPNDACGTCYPTAIASFKSRCSSGRWKCDTCGGSWCEPKCVISAQDPNNKCATAFDSGVADKSSACGKSAKGCANCGGEWCRLGVTKIAGGAGAVNSDGGAASAQNAVATGGFCCYRGNVFAKDMCTACEDVSQDIACADSKGCGTCGGTWCAGPRCVKAFSDTSDPCHSAYNADSVAGLTDYCNGSEDRCSNCGGAWCTSTDITFENGQKFDPDATPSSAPSADSSGEEQTEDEEEKEETFEPFDDLFPHQLP
ncbi:unnamed protein product [Durusdinium trenchii]|uniref:Uncharacterized protein n=2 Tax=Durusdinium trenchii TaxID=1381693 RepID=A0ABP0PFN9_9DINO